ncbi:MAG TPA: PadR family transcriptional regulator [Candidatus Pelethomonas intestinigallinarum]|nr:PadR family transcriptional regulator [Candidatus Pelethomonas intestinigallinarum]
MTFAMGTPLLDGCVLAILDQEDTYGYALTQRVKGVLDISESTLYPVLRRLQKEGCLTVYDQPYQGRNRRYYAITHAGKRRLAEARREWRMFRDSVESLLLKEETSDD